MEKRTKKGFGFEAFSKVFDELNETTPIKRIKGSWHRDEEFQDFEEGMSANLKSFLIKEKGKSDEAAAYKTPTGKWAKRLGFNECVVISVSRESTQVDLKKTLAELDLSNV